MKKIIAIFFIFLLTLSASYSKANQSRQQAEELCELILLRAETVMWNRQNNVPLEQVLESIKNTTGFTRELYTGLIVSAYKIPIYGTEKSRNDMIRIFKEQMYFLCREKTINSK